MERAALLTFLGRGLDDADRGRPLSTPNGGVQVHPGRSQDPPRWTGLVRSRLGQFCSWCRNRLSPGCRQEAHVERGHVGLDVVSTRCLRLAGRCGQSWVGRRSGRVGARRYGYPARNARDGRLQGRRRDPRPPAIPPSRADPPAADKVAGPGNASRLVNVEQLCPTMRRSTADRTEPGGRSRTHLSVTVVGADPSGSPAIALGRSPAPPHIPAHTRSGC